MNTQVPFYIVSAELAELDETCNNARSATLAAQLRKLGYAIADVTGCYKGRTERAFLVLDDRPNLEWCHADVLRLARTYCQESILAVDANRRARLIWCKTGFFESIGNWKGASESNAKARDAWTARAGHYYIVE
jgi:hypothetical protein